MSTRIIYDFYTNYKLSLLSLLLIVIGLTMIIRRELGKGNNDDVSDNYCNDN